MFAERLSALDASFLDLETYGSRMQIGALALFDAAPLTLEHGGIDFDRIARFVEGAIEAVPRYRQRILRAAGVTQPYWVDDDHFRLGYHVRHTALPAPGTMRQLKRLTGRVFSQKLEHDRPLWQLWVVEGVEDGRFAMIFTAHHCLADGIAGAGILQALFTSPEREPKPWTPRAIPSRTELLAAEVKHRTEGLAKVPELVRHGAEEPRAALDAARRVVEEGMSTLNMGVSAASASPLNPPHIGPHRRFDVCRFDLNEMKRVKNELGGKLNDVVLAVAAGGIGRYLRRRGEDPASLDDFRALIPVNTRGGATQSTGNAVALMYARLPLAIEDPVERYRAVLAETRHAKSEAGHARASELFESLADRTATALVTGLMRLATARRSYNVVITNVPGPPLTLSLLGAPLRRIYPEVPALREPGARDRAPELRRRHALGLQRRLERRRGPAPPRRGTSRRPSPSCARRSREAHGRRRTVSTGAGLRRTTRSATEPRRRRPGPRRPCVPITTRSAPSLRA